MVDTVFEDLSPIFIVGSTRSGTTLARAVLSAHPNIAICDGLHYFPEIVPYAEKHPDLGDERTLDAFLDWLPRARHASHLLEILPLLPEIRVRLRREARPTYAHYFRFAMEAYARSRGRSRPGDKTCAHIRWLDRLFGLFPAARVIHMVRDPRAVAASHLAVGWASHEVLSHAVKWCVRVDAWRAFAARRPDLGRQLLEVRYEDLVARPRETIGQLAAFVGEAFDPRMLEHHRYADIRIEHQPWKLAVRDPIGKRAIGRWRTQLEPSRVALIEWIVGPRLRACGYEPEAPELPAHRLAATALAELQSLLAHRRGRARPSPDPVYYRDPGWLRDAARVLLASAPAGAHTDPPAAGAHRDHAA